MSCLIVGPAKSGTTALLALIGKAMDAPSLFVEEPLDSVLRALPALPGDAVAKVLFGNESTANIARAASGFDRCVLLVRDPRDTLVSSLLYTFAAHPERLQNSALLDRFCAMLRAKQADPGSIPLGDIARLRNNTAGAFVDGHLLHQAEFARFVAEAGAGWHVVRYEDMVAGRLDALSRTLGLTLEADVAVPSEYARVARSKSAGDWRHWFTPQDVAALRPVYDPVLSALGYPCDWELAPIARIAPEHSWLYFERLVDERLRHYGLPARQPARAAERLACNLCGGDAFGPGPAGRLSTTGAAPCCLKCGSLERQRIVRRLFEAMPVDFLDWRHALQFTRLNGLPEARLRQSDVEAPDASLGLRPSLRDAGSVDLVAFSHLLEYTPHDVDGFAGLVSLLSPHGFMLASFATCWSRPSTLEPAGAEGAGGPLRLYGRDLEQRFDCKERGLTVLAVEEADPCTGAREVVHLFFKDPDDAARVRAWLLDSSGTLQLLSYAGVPAVGSPSAPLQATP